MAEFKIEKGVEIPRKGRGRGRPSKYPWADMEVGDSFRVPNRKHPPNPPCKQLGAGKKFVSRPTDDGYRIWRVK